MLGWPTPDLGRWVNVVLAAVAVGLMLWYWRRWAPLSRGRRFHWASTFLFCVATLLGTLGVLFRTGEVWRVAAFTFALLWAIAAVLMSGPRGRRDPPG